MENLLISMNEMDHTAIYSLGDLIRNKNCKLRILSCGFSNFHNTAGQYFLKSLTKNDTLQELYLYQAQLDDSDFEIIKNVIVNSKLNILSLYKNNIKNFDTILKLLSLTSILKIKQYVEPQNVLCSLDLSENPINQKTIVNTDIALLNFICQKSGLSIFDLTHIIHGNSKDTKEINEGNISNTPIDSISNTNSSNIRFIKMNEESNFDSSKVLSFDDEENNFLDLMYRVQDEFKIIY